jgi:hypothetical protein
MNVTLDESIAIYARATLRWFGAKARERTQERIEQLANTGDFESATVHERVKERIFQLEQQRAAEPVVLLGKGSLVSRFAGA